MHTQALQKTDTGEAVCILGKVKVQVNYGEQTYQLLVYVRARPSTEIVVWPRSRHSYG